LRSGAIIHWGTIRSGASVPNTENPFLGIVIRAIEHDNSGYDRQKDKDRFFNDIRNYLQNIVDSGAIPTANQLLEAGTQRNLIDNFGDDDDRIGVNARAFPSFGSSPI